jgi:ABC-type Fe3+/spermidine/putrescine transport system ATPase subunit
VTGSDHSGSIEIDTAMGRLKMTAPQKDYAVGEKVVALIRPESVKIIFEGDEKSGAMLPGTILRGNYLGSQVIYTIKAGDETLTITVPNPTEKEVRGPGEKINLVLPEYIHLIDAAKAGEILNQ